MLELNNAQGVDLSPEFRPMLKELQANILKGHGRDFAHHIFLRIKPDRAGEARKWIADFAKTRITSSERQLDDRNRNHATSEDGGPVFCLSISATGYKSLG